jgi:hypothetical protein
MTETGMRCNSPEEAAAVALAWCIRDKGNYCLAYSGVNCSKCPKREEGLKRRKEKADVEDKETIQEILYGDDYFDKDKKRRIRFRKTSGDYVIEFGKRYSDNPTIFHSERRLFFTEKERKLFKDLLAKVDL